MKLENLKETLGAVRRKKVKPKVCPRCGSTDISILTLTGYIAPPAYLCNKCGFHGTLFLEVEKEEGEAGTESSSAQ
ncbi:MAG: hypothetical protein ACUVQ5_04240 [Candidatus Methanomethylicaceae archaeon]